MGLGYTDGGVPRILNRGIPLRLIISTVIYMISKYYDIVKQYTMMPKDMGFNLMETIISEMEDDGMTFSTAYELFNEIVDYVYDMDLKGFA